MLWLGLCVVCSQFKVDTAAHFSKAPEISVEFNKQFESIRTLDSWYSFANQCSIAINMIRAVLYFQFHQRLSIVTKTLSTCFADLIHFVILYFIMILLFGFMGFRAVGGLVREFRGYALCLNTLLGMSIGDMDSPGVDVIMQAEPVIGLVFFWSFILIMALLLVNVFVAIVVDGYVAAKTAMTQSNSILSTFSAVGKLKSLKYNCAEKLPFGKRANKTKGVVVKPDAATVDGSSEPDAAGVQLEHEISRSHEAQALLKRMGLAKAKGADILALVNMMSGSTNEDPGEGGGVDTAEMLVRLDKKLDTLLLGAPPSNSKPNPQSLPSLAAHDNLGLVKDVDLAKKALDRTITELMALTGHE